MNVTWIKSGQSGQSHAVDRKGSDLYVTQCGVAISVQHAIYSQAGDICPACEKKLKNKR